MMPALDRAMCVLKYVPKFSVPLDRNPFLLWLTLGERIKGSPGNARMCSCGRAFCE